MRAVVMTATGGREVLEQIERPEPVAGPGEALVEIAVAGVNFMDIGVRQGIAWTDMPNPKILGVEGVGRVLAVGEGVEAVQPGQRVAWVYAPGSYAERIAIPATSLVPVPDAVDDRTAASIMMQGLTASHFATDFYPVQPGDVAFVHAAAGGVGLLLTQIIKLRGGRVIGRVSSEDKVAVAREVGADHVIVDTEGRFAEEALRLTDGEGVHVVYDGSGPTTFQGSLDVLRRSGTFCWYGPVLGGPGPLDIEPERCQPQTGDTVMPRRPCQSSSHSATPSGCRWSTPQIPSFVGRIRIFAKTLFRGSTTFSNGITGSRTPSSVRMS